MYYGTNILIFYELYKCIQPNMVFIGFCSVIIYLGYQVDYSRFTLLKKLRLIISGLQRCGLLVDAHGHTVVYLV